MNSLSTLLCLLSLSTASLADEDGVELEVVPPIESIEGVTLDRMRAPLLELGAPASSLSTVEVRALDTNLALPADVPDRHQAGRDCSVARHGCVGSARLTLPLGKRSDATATVSAGIDHALTLQERARREHHRRELDAVFERLQLAWAYGEPLTGHGSPAATPNDRRRAILSYWAALPNTPRGQEEREVIREFLIHVVQPSPWPVTQQELDVTLATCGCEHPLEL